ncbi:FAD-linked oxidoreductase [Colletotrichum gloeosporioides]|uniref:FAD-linked oxidoreductase n=1 Tax=Colletotrichum gloeosporioides TaxID=474922 RepID=A0A8H4CQ78_COLGL|nr:FAD-linked oxidoreductase [Colletotrichum gloeosporioides]KAF3807862.1 FAD-linked oxidoreductase [Colletotrichum gloeosporioides]
MATLDHLKCSLRQQQAMAGGALVSQPLSDEQYSTGFNIFKEGSVTYNDFIKSQLTQVLTPIFKSRLRVSVLEIGPGPKSVLGCVPLEMRRKITSYSALEPNGLFAPQLEEWLKSADENGLPLPCLEGETDARRLPFDLASSKKTFCDEKFDVIIFCHSMYDMHPKHEYLRAALDLLVDQPANSTVIVFHRDGPLHLQGLVPYQVATFPTGIVRVEDSDDSLDRFIPFIAGYVPKTTAIQLEWRNICRSLGRRDKGHLIFAAPEVMMAFTRHSTALPELTSKVPVADGEMQVKNREARLHRPAAIIRPSTIQHVQECVRWALRHRMALTVVGGGHSGHCFWSNVVAVDMSAFNQVHVVTDEDDVDEAESLVVAGAGCKTGDIIAKAMEEGLTVPLGSRPSVGAGLWLQGGIGHLARIHGLTCDAIVGAVLVSVESGGILCVGRVPAHHQPTSATRPANEEELLWAIKGAGTNFGIVVSVTFAAHPAPMFSVRKWIIPMSDGDEAQRTLAKIDKPVASQLPRSSSADAYLYWDAGQLHLGVTMYEATTAKRTLGPPTSVSSPIARALGPEYSFRIVDSIGLFETEMYMSTMHGGHAGGKTSSFKRCIFLKDIGKANIASALIAAVETRPSLLCYLHLLHGGGAVRDIPETATAFGCRDWDFACVITGVWPRGKDGTDVCRAVVEWVYAVARTLLPLSTGVYGADLGPDPRDAVFATKAFGPNPGRLARLKRTADPRNVLAYTCPLPKEPMESALIILVTGDSCAGKDYCAAVWADIFNKAGKTTRVVSISDAIKREYATATGADLERLLHEREYKEYHRLALAAFFQNRVQKRPQILEEHFLEVVYGAAGVDVLFITGMRDEAPVADLSHLVPDSKLVDIRVNASKETRWRRRGASNGEKRCNGTEDHYGESATSDADYSPSMEFHNDVEGNEALTDFASKRLLPLAHDDLNKLADMIRVIPDFPRQGIDFRHVLDIAQKPGGLALSASLLQSHFAGDWDKADAIVCCETGGFIFASALAVQLGKPLVPIREAGKLPLPTVSIAKSTSHISSGANGVHERRIEMDRDVLPKAASVVVVDDVFASGETMYAVLELLKQVGVGMERVSVVVVAEFPRHRGRALLRGRGFGRVIVQSLLVFGGA